MFSPDSNTQEQYSTNQLINTIAEESLPKALDMVLFTLFTIFSAFVAYVSGLPFGKAGGEGTQYVWPWGIYGIVDENLGRFAALWLNATLNFFFLIDFALNDGLKAMAQQRVRKKFTTLLNQETSMEQRLSQWEQRLPKWRRALAIGIAITGAFAFFVLSYFLNQDSLEIALLTQLAIAAGNITSAETLLSKTPEKYSDSKKQTLQSIREAIQISEITHRVTHEQFDAIIQKKEINPSDATEQTPLLPHENSFISDATDLRSIKTWALRLFPLIMGPTAYYWQTIKSPALSEFNFGQSNFNLTIAWVFAVGGGLLGTLGALSFILLIANGIGRIGTRLKSVYDGIKEEGHKWFTFRRTVLSILTTASFVFLGTLSANTAQRVNHAQFGDNIWTYLLDGLVEMCAALFNTQGIFFLLNTLFSIGSVIKNNCPHSPFPSFKLNWILHTLYNILEKANNKLLESPGIAHTIQAFGEDVKAKLTGASPQPHYSV